MKSFCRKYYPLILMMAALFASTGYLVYETYLVNTHYPEDTIPNKAKQKARGSVYIAILTLGEVGLILAFRRMRRIESVLDWHIDAVNLQIKSLQDGFNTHTHEVFEESPVSGEKVEGSDQPSRWPWGSHHTQYLGHLEAAARKWWVLYDPSDATTAPTNDMVSEWLQLERNVSKEKAKAIASMLRPDGLPTGPRK